MYSKSRNGYFKLLLFLSLILFFLIAGARKTENLISSACYPFLRAVSFAAAPFKNLKQNIKRIYRNYKNHERLEIELNDLIDENVALRSMLNFQERSKELVEFEERYQNDKKTIARILTTELSAIEHFCIIDKGKLSGIEENMSVVNRTQIIGKVSKVYPTYSKVTLITDRSCKVSVSVRGSSQYGLCEGTNEKALCKIRYLKNPQDLKLNSMVISSGKGLVFPEGFLVGFISSIKPDGGKEPGEWLIEVKPHLNIEDLDFCHVIFMCNKKAES
jgi:rod shape-determining protein MreC